MKRKIAALLLLPGILFSVCGCQADGGLRLSLQPDHLSAVNGGVFEGWGTSLCWWANRVGYSETLAQLAAEAVCWGSISCAIPSAAATTRPTSISPARTP